MIEVKKALDIELSNRHSETYYQDAIDPTFPYIVFDFDLTDISENDQMISLSIDGWDNKASTAELENMMNAVDLNEVVITEGDTTIVLFRQYRKAINEDDPKIKRRRYLFEGYVYERSQ